MTQTNYIRSLDDFNPNSPLFVIPFFPLWVAYKIAEFVIAKRYPHVVEITQEEFGRTSVSFERFDVVEWLEENKIAISHDEFLKARFKTEADVVAFRLRFL